MRLTCFVLMMLYGCVFLPPSQAKASQTGKIISAITVSSIALLMGGALSYRYRIAKFFSGKKNTLSTEQKATVKRLSVYQTIATTPFDCLRVGLYEEAQKQVVCIEHEDFIKDAPPLYMYAFYDAETDLLARVFKSGNRIIIAFRGSEKYLDRLKRYMPGHFKAIEWSEAVYDFFGDKYQYEVIGHCAGGGHAMLAGLQLYYLSKAKVPIEVVGFNSSIPRFDDFFCVSKNVKIIKKYLKYHVTVYQNINDPVYKFGGIDSPFLGLWTWYCRESKVFALIDNYICFLPKNDGLCSSDTEKKNFIKGFSLLHRFYRSDTWQHSAIKWMHYLMGLDSKSVVKFLNI